MQTVALKDRTINSLTFEQFKGYLFMLNYEMYIEKGRTFILSVRSLPIFNLFCFVYDLDIKQINEGTALIEFTRTISFEEVYLI
jgi:hypothetical protein